MDVKEQMEHDQELREEATPGGAKPQRASSNNAAGVAAAQFHYYVEIKL
jgi:hypothetical protein